jgi:long-subunit acyl-CoA synthetase (AMP-forming)
MYPTLTLRDRIANMRELCVSSASESRSSDPRSRATTIGRDLARMGLRRGDRLGVVLPNGLELVATLIACLEREIVFVPLHPDVSDEEMAQRLCAVGASSVTSPGEGLRRISFGEPSPSVPNRIPAVIFFTSGSAGTARPVAVSDEALMHVADTHHAALGYSPGDTLTGYLPWSHAFGFTLELLMALLYEGALRSVSSAVFPEVFDAAPSDCLFTVPRMVERLSDRSLSKVKSGIVGGAPVHGRVRRRLQSTQLRVGYGQTECAPGVSLGNSGEWEQDDFLGRPFGCDVVLRAGPDEGVGELTLRGRNLAMGYAQGDGLIPVVSADGWRATGDLATRSGDGFVFQGRKDELFKLDNGRMVNPVPLERPYDGRILLIGQGREAVQPLLMQGEVPQSFALPVPFLQPILMPEAFWSACTTPTGKVSRQRAQRLFYQP